MSMRKIQPESPSEMFGPMEMAKGDAKVIFPSANFDHRSLPEAKDWGIGKTYRVTMDLKMKGASTRTASDGKERGNFDFDIVGVDASAGEQKGKNTRYA